MFFLADGININRHGNRFELIFNNTVIFNNSNVTFTINQGSFYFYHWYLFDLKVEDHVLREFEFHSDRIKFNNNIDFSLVNTTSL